MRRLTIVVALLGLASLAAAQAPAGADRVATANGLRLHYLEWGDPAKPPMILLHGIARHAHTFDHVAPAFARDHHVIALDMRGHGDSAWSPEGAYLVQDYVGTSRRSSPQLRLRRADAARQLDGRPRRAGFAGLHPDLVERLVVEDVGPERPQNIADAFARRVEQEANGWATEDELVAQLVAANRRTPEPLLRTYAHFGVKPRADGRLVWKRDPNLVKGSSKPSCGMPSRRSGAGALRHRRRQPHRAARDAGAAQKHAPRLPRRRHAGARDTIRARKTPKGFLRSCKPFLRQ